MRTNPLHSFLATLTLIGAVGLVMFFGSVPSRTAEASGASRATRECVVSTVTKAGVGHQASSVILAENSNRAWARIQQPDHATNTPSVSFDEGAAATLNSGLTLSKATSTNPVPFIDFGLNTDFAYTGEVEAITDVGSSTLLVTECVYP